MVQFLGLAISMVVGKMWATMEVVSFCFWLFFCAMILSSLFKNPENARVM